MRMDKYNENKKENTYSREYRNQDMYDDVYKNEDIEDYLDKTKQHINIVEEIKYKEKSYSVDDYLRDSYNRREQDNLKRELESDYDVLTVSESKDEISIIINEIENREEDLFTDLIDENEETTSEIKLTSILDNNNEEETPEKEEFTDTIIKKPKKKKKLKKQSIPIIIFMISLILLIGVLIYIFIN